jgi:hypothetical protein
MRTFFPSLLLAPLAVVATPDVFGDFAPAVEQLPTVAYNQTETSLEGGSADLVKREGACARDYFDCERQGEPGLCCPRNAVCSADYQGHVGCCPQGVRCTGTIGGAIATGANPTQTGPVIVTTTDDDPFVQATATGNGANPGSTVQNQFYPFPYIPTTYTNAAACSSAYTSCQEDAASCTAALVNGANGVTIDAPNGGATITAVPSVGPESARSICQSLSQEACSGLQVEACAAFDGPGNGNAARRARCADYLMTAGVAVGIAGQLLR